MNQSIMNAIREIRFEDYESVRKRFVLRAVNRRVRHTMLRSCPYQEKEDLALVCYIDLGVSEGREQAVRVLLSHLDIWGVSSKKLFEDALEQSPRCLPPLFQPIEKMIDPRLIGQDEPLDPQSMLYVLTNERKTFGASALFYPGLMEEIYQQTGAYYILPSSVHEFIIVRDQEAFSPEALAQIVRQVNEQELTPDQFLSDHVYYYGGSGVPFQTV